IPRRFAIGDAARDRPRPNRALALVRSGSARSARARSGGRRARVAAARQMLRDPRPAPRASRVPARPPPARRYGQPLRPRAGSDPPRARQARQAAAWLARAVAAPHGHRAARWQPWPLQWRVCPPGLRAFRRAAGFAVRARRPLPLGAERPPRGKRPLRAAALPPRAALPRAP